MGLFTNKVRKSEKFVKNVAEKGHPRIYRTIFGPPSAVGSNLTDVPEQGIENGGAQSVGPEMRF